MKNFVDHLGSVSGRGRDMRWFLGTSAAIICLWLALALTAPRSLFELTGRVVSSIEFLVLYWLLLPLSIPGAIALIAALWLGRGQPLRPKLWFLLPLFISWLAVVIIPWLAMTIRVFDATGVAQLEIWVALFSGLELATIGLAVAYNRATILVALLLAVFVATFAIAAAVFMGLDVSCWRGC